VWVWHLRAKSSLFDGWLHTRELRGMSKAAKVRARHRGPETGYLSVRPSAFQSMPFTIHISVCPCAQDGNNFRREWDKEAFEKRAKERLESVRDVASTRTLIERGATIRASPHAPP
jgi:hypothetical protein